MPQYTFVCDDKGHDKAKHGDASFVRFIQHREGKRIDQFQCSCGATAKRDLVSDLASVNVNGLAPVSHSTTLPGSLAHTTEFAFGRFKEDERGATNKNERPFKDSGELARYMNGDNDLGPPQLDDKGNPRRRSDGSIIRRGAKLFQYGKNDTPARSGVGPRSFVPDPRIVIEHGWDDEDRVLSQGTGGRGMAAADFAKEKIPVSSYRSPSRKAKA